MSGGNLRMLVEEVCALGQDPAEWRPLIGRIRENTAQLSAAARSDNEEPSLLIGFVRAVNSPSYGPIPTVLLAIQAKHPQQLLPLVAETGNLLRRILPEQIQASPKEFVGLCRRVTIAACDAGIANMLIRPLMHAIDALSAEPNRLTVAHVLVLQACISAKCYSVGARFIRERPVFGLAKDETLDSGDYLRYFYYAGLIAVGQKNFADALDYFMKAVTVPATAVSAIMIESYKKAALVALIKNGKRLELPRITANVVQRHCHRHEILTEQFAQMFQTRNLHGLNELIVTSEGALNQDRSLGLAKQVVAALTKHQIRELTDTYITLSLSDIGSSAGGISATEAERALLDMVKSNAIAATIDDTTQMVRFLDEQEALAGSKVFDRLEDAMVTAMKLNEHIRQLEAKLYTNPTFISKASSSGGRAVAHDRIGIEDLDLYDMRMGGMNVNMMDL